MGVANGFVDLTGKRFGRLVVLTRAENHGRYPMWTSRCDCGREKTAMGTNLRQGRTTSCGCFMVDRAREASVTHNENGKATRTAEYTVWASMKQRCFGVNTKAYADYGGRGITVCERWLSYENFLADMGRRPSPNHTIERTDNDAGYSLENCRWATSREQAQNRRSSRTLTAHGETLCITEWARRTGLSRRGIRLRLERGLSDEAAVRQTPQSLRKTNKEDVQ